MADPFMGRCGIDCNDCEYRAPMNCPGCVCSEGKPFWGECSVAKCSADKGHEHCGKCQEFPCEMLNKFAYDPDQGDNGKRISNLREWNEKGYAAWRRERNESS
jgi:hypothetical protein